MGKGMNAQLVQFKQHFLEKETAIQFQLMSEAAEKDGVSIQLVSAFRSYAKQKEIFEWKYQKLQADGVDQLKAIEQITKYSSIPGTSRHHWGTDVDVIQKNKQNSTIQNVLLTENFEEGGIYNPLHLWMQKHAADFGFHLSYTDDSNRSGYQYEPWHYSYLPVSKRYLQDYVALQMAEELQNETVHGLQDLTINFYENYIQNFVLGVNSILK